MNNAIGHAWISVEDMTHAVVDYMRVMKWEGCPEKLADHVTRGGWYSSEVIAHAINTTSMKNAGHVEYKLGLEPLCKNPDRIYSPYVLGALVNKQNVHWVAIRFIDGILYLLDSQRGRPEAMSERDFRYFVKKHENAYCLERADDMSLPSSSLDSGSTAAPRETASPLLPLVDSSASGTAVASMEFDELVEDSAMGGEDPNAPGDYFLDAAGEPAAQMEVDEDLGPPEYPLDALAPALAIAEQIDPKDADQRESGSER